MENVHSAGVIEYEKSLPFSEKKFTQKFLLYFHVLYDCIRLLIILLPIALYSIFRCVYPKDKKSIVGKLAVVTGGGNGLGREIALRLAERGCNIVLVDVDMKAADNTVKDLLKFNIIASAYKVDVGDPTAVNNFVKKIDKIDILINNAGLIPKLSVLGGTTMDVEKIIDVNIKSHLWMIRGFLPGMIAHKSGHIVAISSGCAIHPMPYMVTYSATKAAVTGFMEGLSEELRQDGHDFVKTTTVHPYYIATRRDVMEMINPRFPPVSVETAAQLTVDGILCEEEFFTIPKYVFFTSEMTHILPLKMRKLIRDIVMRETEINKKIK